MILYLCIIIACMTLIAGLNILFSSVNMWFIISAVTICTVLQFVIDGIIAIVVNKLPNKWFHKDSKFFHVSRFSQNFYEKIHIRNWKDKVWELGGLGGFSKDKLKNPKDPKYIEQFIVESHKGILTHRLSYPLGFLVIFVFPFKYCFTICIPVAIVNLLLNALPVMILRYNLPKLHALHKRLNRSQEIEQKKDIA